MSNYTSKTEFRPPSKKLGNQPLLDLFIKLMPRRHFLLESGKVLLRMVGIVFLPLVPFRTASAAAALSFCTTNDLFQGMWGTPCWGLDTCPSCCQPYDVENGSWVFCVKFNAKPSHCTLVQYLDCCAPIDINNCYCYSYTGNTNTTCNSPCHRNPCGEQPSWCPAGTYYVCTIGIARTSCGDGCPNC